MSQFSHQVRNGIVWLTFDSGAMNTLSGEAVRELTAKISEINKLHAESPLKGVVLKGNRFGLGAGANIGELMNADRAALAAYIDAGHAAFFAIAEGPLPWLAAIDGYALGGIYELALACHGIVSTERSTVGFPEIRLNIFPGLGGTQRMPRRSGLVNGHDAVNGDAGFSAILNGKNFKAKSAASIKMIDAVVPEGEELDAFAEQFLLDVLPRIDRTPPSDLARAESQREKVLPLVQKLTMGRPNPRAPYVAVDVMIRGANLPLRAAIAIERDAFLDVATSPEGKAGMRFFFTQQAVQKLPKGFPGKARPLKKIGVDGADGYMGNAIAWLSLEAGYEVVAHAPLAEFAPGIPTKLAAKYARVVKRGAMSQADADKKVDDVKVTTEIADLFDCDLVIEARMENREVKAEFYRRLGAGMKAGAIVASNSSSMGPALLGGFFAEKGGRRENFVNLHFFSPAEHPAMQLVEVVVGKESTPDVVATAHAFVRSINKTPVVLQDGSVGFLVNAALAEYWEAAELLYREGTPIAAVDEAIRRNLFPMGPFELADQAGVDVCAGLFDTVAAESPRAHEPILWRLREAKRLGVKNGAGYYDYRDGKKESEWNGLAALVPGRGARIADEAEIVERCLRALHKKARELCDRRIVASEEECDLAFVIGLNFAMYLGGPLFCARQRGWEK